LDVLAFPDVSFDDLIALDADLVGVDEDSRRQVEREALYAHYIVRQEKDVEALRRDENHLFPKGFDYSKVQGLSNELKQKLSVIRPATLAQAGRVDGMTPAALALLLARLRRSDKERRA